MFLRPSILNRLMKQAYKGGGLALARPAGTEDKLYIAGSYWEAEIRMGFIPKETMGDIIKLSGELPDTGERFRVTKDEVQMETGFHMEVDTAVEDKGTGITITDMILIGSGGTHQRLIQDEGTGNIYAVNNVFVDIVDNSQIDDMNGETSADTMYCDGISVLWKNNVCKLRASLRFDQRNDKVMKNLGGVDITPGDMEEQEDPEE